MEIIIFQMDSNDHLVNQPTDYNFQFNSDFVPITSGQFDMKVTMNTSNGGFISNQMIEQNSIT